MIVLIIGCLIQASVYYYMRQYRSLNEYKAQSLIKAGKTKRKPTPFKIDMNQNTPYTNQNTPLFSPAKNSDLSERSNAQ